MMIKMEKRSWRAVIVSNINDNDNEEMLRDDVYHDDGCDSHSYEEQHSYSFSS